MGTMISWLALLIALLAVAYAWQLQQELKRVTRRLDRYNRALFDANEEARKARIETTDALAQLQAEMQLAGNGRTLFKPAMTVREAIALHPQAAQVLAASHLGGCSSCAVDTADTLATICRENGRDLSQLLQNLNLLVVPGQEPQNGQHSLKVPNVELSF